MIEAVSAENIEEVLPLIRAYQTFYKVENINDERNKVFFSQFGLQSPLGCQFLYRDNAKAVAFATVYFSFSSSLAAKVGVLNDLFTAQEVRGKGIGRALIEHAKSFALSQQAVRLQWITATDNQSAQMLYDSMDTKKSTWHFYTYSA